jgi:purine-binding chemotaxis protein CheW
VSVYVRLQVGSEAYAVPVEQVSEVAALGPVRPVPGSGPELVGVCNLRGQIIPVADLALLLGVARVAPPGCLLVTDVAGRRAGFAIDGVSAVGELADPADDAPSELLVGAALAGDRLIGVLDVPRVLDKLEQVRP